MALTTFEEQKVREILTRSYSLNGRRIGGAGISQFDHDYVVRREIKPYIQTYINAGDYKYGGVLQNALDDVDDLFGGAVLVPPGNYRQKVPLKYKNNTTMFGTVYTEVNTGGGPFSKTNIIADFDGDLMVPYDNTTISWCFRAWQLAFYGTGNAGSRGFNVLLANGYALDHCFFSNFGEEAILFKGGADGWYSNLFSQGTCLNRAGLTDFKGGIDIGVNDAQWYSIKSTVSANAYGSGYATGIINRGYSTFMLFCFGHISELGLLLTGQGSRLVGVRTDLNYGNGFNIQGADNFLDGLLSFRNSQAGDGLYSGYKVYGTHLYFNGCETTSLVGDPVCLHGIEDSSNDSGGVLDATNIYLFCRASPIHGEQVLKSGNTLKLVIDSNGTEFRIDGSLACTRIRSIKGGTPTLTPGVGIGTSPSTIDIEGNDQCGYIRIVTGTSCPAGPSTVGTFNYADGTYNPAPTNITLTPANAAAMALGVNGWFVEYSTVGLTGFDIKTQGTALGDVSQYVYWYDIKQ